MASTKKKSVKVAIVKCDQIIQHILPLGPSETTERKQRNGTTKFEDRIYSASFLVNKNSQHTKRDELLDSDDIHERNDYGDILSEDCNNYSDSMFREQVFQFRTPKKSGQMATKAKDCYSPCTPKKTQTRSKMVSPCKDKSPGPKVDSDTRVSQRLGRQSKTGEPSTPKRSLGVVQRNHKRMESTTPYRLRKRNLDLQQQDSSSDDSVDESSDDDEEEKGDEEDNNFQEKSQMASAGSDKINMAATAEVYFDLHSMAPVTSDRTLSALDSPRLDVDTIREVLQKVSICHQKQLGALMKKHQQLFNKWMFHMCCGYNILLHGIGSKRALLEKFREQHLLKFTHLVVNGYFPSLTIKHILNSITEDILENTKGFSDIYSQVEFIKDSYKMLNEDFYLIIHNIDGVLLRSEKSQTILSHLSQIEGFHIVASVDHINAALMWDQNKYFRFHWLWYETPTFLPYEAENAYENSLMVQHSGSLALSSIIHVMRSLTPNARQVFLLLAEYQLETRDVPNYPGMSFQSLYQKCREAFLVNSDLTLQAQLVEFKDHRLIRSRKNYEGIEHLVIPVDSATLKVFLQEHKDGHS